MEEQLKAIYFDPQDPGSLGGVMRLLKQARLVNPKITEQDVKHFLSKFKAYTLHKPYRRRYVRNKTIVGSIDKQWQVDLCDMTYLTHANSGHRYILTVIDCFSRFAWAIPTKKKSGLVVTESFRKLFKLSAPRLPQRIQSDKGTEFFNKDVQGFLKSKKVHLFASESEFKAAVVERFNRTLKTRLWRYFTANGTDRYLEVLPKIMHSYNHSVHRVIGQTPVSVKKKDERKIWMRQFATEKQGRKSKNLPKDGDTVRISNTKDIFSKGYEPNFTEEPFIVESSQATEKPVYKLKDTLGEEVKGRFYTEQLQTITANDDDTYLIEKVVKKRTVNGIAESFIKWQGLPKKFNSWIPSTDITKHGRGE